MTIRNILAVVPFLAPTFACIDAPLEQLGAITLAPNVSAGGTLTGITRDVGGRLHVLVEGQGIVVIDGQGRPAERFNVGDRGLVDRPYRDLTVLDDGRYLLIADNEGYLYDPVTEQHRVHFCVEPGFNGDCFDQNGNLIDSNNNGICDWDEEPSILPVTLTQKNDALALVNGRVVAAPRFYEGDVRVEHTLRSYDIATGDSIGASDISDIDLDLAGLTASGTTLVGVEGGSAVLFGLDGVPRGKRALVGVEDAAGVVADVGGDVLVLDAAAQAIVRFNVNER